MYKIISTILWIVFGFLVTYFKTRTDIIEIAKAQIANAELIYQDAKSGEKKMQYVVDWIQSIIPAPLQLIFTEEIIRNIVQGVFDSIEKYATIQIDKLLKGKHDKED